MKSTDVITLEFLQSQDACKTGVEWFQRNFPAGGEYQTVLDRLAQAEEDLSVWAGWLIEAAGASDEVREIEGDLKARSYFFCGSLKVSGLIEIELNVTAGRNVTAGWSVTAGRNVTARDGSVTARDGSVTARDGSVTAGWDVTARDGSVTAGWDVTAGGSVTAREGDVTAGWSVTAREGDVTAGGSVTAREGSVTAGGSVTAREGSVTAGADYGIFVGLKVRLSLWSRFGFVKAKEQPANLKTGVFVPSEPEVQNERE